MITSHGTMTVTSSNQDQSREITLSFVSAPYWKISAAADYRQSRARTLEFFLRKARVIVPEQLIRPMFMEIEHNFVIELLYNLHSVIS